MIQKDIKDYRKSCRESNIPDRTFVLKLTRETMRECIKINNIIHKCVKINKKIPKTHLKLYIIC